MQEYIYIYSFSRRFYPKRLTIEEYNKRYIIKRQTVTGSACHTTFQALFRIKLARQGEVMEREQRVFYLFYFLWRRRSRSQVMTEEMCFQVSLESGQGFSSPNGGGKFIPPARNGEWKRSGKWFCASLWWNHEALLTRRSQTSWGDVDS